MNRQADLDFDFATTYYNPRSKVQIHRYSNSIKVFDLTNAGKRGKKVPGFTLTGFNHQKLPNWTPETMFLWDQFVISAKAGKDFLYLRRLAQDIADNEDAKRAGELYLNESRGVDVNPMEGAKAPVKLDTPHFNLEASVTEFTVRDKKDKMNEPVIYQASRTDAARFHNWVSSNLETVKTLTFRELERAITGLGIKSKFYLAVD